MSDLNTHERDLSAQIADRMLSKREVHFSPTFSNEYERGHHKGMFDGLEEPINRVKRGISALEALANDAPNALERVRLLGKKSGMQIALDHLLEEQSLRREP